VFEACALPHVFVVFAASVRVNLQTGTDRACVLVLDTTVGP
jgi:hypothetical protein